MNKRDIELRNTLRLLNNALLEIEMYWEVLLAIFGEKWKLDLLNRAGGRIFRFVEDAMVHELILRICRLTDRPNVLGHSTVSITALQQLAEEFPNEMRKELDAVIRRILKVVQDLRVRRDKTLAHSDIEAAVLPKNALPAIRFEHIVQAKEGIEAALNLVREYLGEPSHNYDLGLHRSADLFFKYLQKGEQISRAPGGNLKTES